MPDITTPPWVAHANDKGTRQAVYSLHVHPSGSKLATGSIDTKVKIWNTEPILDQRKEEDPQIPKLLSTLGYHTGPVICVRFSNGDGRFLASGSDDQKILIWELDRSPTAFSGLEFGADTDGEVSVEAWRVYKRLVGHDSDVQDMSWSPDNAYLASCGLDSTVIIWDGQTFDKVKRLHDFTGPVKGVTWDPVGKYLGTQSDDKCTRIWRMSDWMVEAEVKAPYEHAANNTLFRRLSWSPDGSMIVTANGENCAVSVAPVISRDGWKADINLVGHHLPIETASFNPILFQVAATTDPRSPKIPSGVCAVGGQDTTLSVWWTAKPRSAVATCDAATQAIVDLAWSPDGLKLYACSMDGTVTVMSFTEDELGVPVPQSEIDSALIKYGYNRKKTTIVESARQLELEQENAIADKEQSSERLSKLMNASSTVEAAVSSATTASTLAASTPKPAFPRQLTIADKEASAAQTQQRQSVTITSGGKKRIQPVFLGNARTNAEEDVEMTPVAITSQVPQSTAASPTRPDDWEMMPTIPDGGIPSTLAGRKRAGAADEATNKKLAIAKDTVQYVLPSVMDSTNVPILGIPTPKDRLIINVSGESIVTGATIESEGGPCLLECANDIRTGSSKLTCMRGECVFWQDTLSSPVLLMGGSVKFFAACCIDGSLYTFTRSGRRWLPRIYLEGPVVFMDCSGPYLMCLTAGANVHVWNIPKQEAVLSRESIAQLLRTSRTINAGTNASNPAGNNSSSVPALQSFVSVVSATIQPLGIPIITTSDTNSYVFHPGMKVWQRMAKSQDGGAHMQGFGGILSRLAEIRKEGVTARSNRIRVSAISHLEDMLASVLALKSAQEYKHWLHQYVRKLGDEGATAKVRELCDDLIGPPDVPSLPSSVSISSNITAVIAWEPTILGMNKRDLLRELLPTLARSRNLQRVTALYEDRLGCTIANGSSSNGVGRDDMRIDS
ncbi:hypothetical protein SeMB42_g04932 [Synchytrium endobioticum]|uniref:Protein HIR n=1 Tax=Synchytrium endobioticum TaxID=286115 RepID=A0A507CUS5_9FUNG|nr:hypothetical protein SeMB42_g04932 [Synchytrium endobioticum]TPX46068.1 hypothetical protein SeLEV6574_g03441 [Synchytrium endobioticum]